MSHFANYPWANNNGYLVFGKRNAKPGDKAPADVSIVRIHPQLPISDALSLEHLDLLISID